MALAPLPRSALPAALQNGQSPLEAERERIPDIVLTNSDERMSSVLNWHLGAFRTMPRPSACDRETLSIIVARHWRSGMREDNHVFEEDDREPTHPIAALASVALEVALVDERAETLEADGVAVVAIASEAAWMAALRVAFRSRRGDLYVFSVSETRSSSTLEDSIADLLGSGRSVVGIATRVSALPSSLVRTADMHLEIRPPVGAALAEAIARVLGGEPPDVGPTFGAGLTAFELAAAIRANGSVADAVARIERAQGRATGFREGPAPPPLDALHGYGPAMDFCKALVADVAAYRAGRIAWPDVRGAALLASPPGCGKTSLVASLAGEIGAPLVATSVSSWFTAFRDGALDDVIRAASASHASAVAYARANGASVWFVDEIDALPNRATMDGRGREWWTPVVNHVLTLLDGALAAPGVVVIGATNHPERLDPALVRPGRLSRIIEIGVASAADVPGMVRIHLRGDLAGVDLSPLAILGEGRTGAEIAQAVQEARGAARLAARPLALEDVARALAPPDPGPPGQLRRVCVHEAGHTLVARTLGLRVHSVTTIIRGTKGGMALVEEPGGNSPTRADVETIIRVILGGRIAEEILLGAPSAGAAGDLAMATRRLSVMHGVWGLGDRLRTSQGSEYEWDVAQAVEGDLARLYEKTRDLLTKRIRQLEALAEELARRRVLDEAAIDEAIARAARRPGRHR